MSKSAISVLAFGLYDMVLGLILLLTPNTLLGLFGFPPTTEPWIRVVGMFLLILAYFLIGTARKEVKTFFRLTVHTRASVILFFLAFVLFDLAAPALLLFSVIDLAAAIWTALALKSESEPVLKFL